jgi:hypothetical protein
MSSQHCVLYSTRFKIVFAVTAAATTTVTTATGCYYVNGVLDASNLGCCVCSKLAHIEGVGVLVLSACTTLYSFSPTLI